MARRHKHSYYHHGRHYEYIYICPDKQITTVFYRGHPLVLILTNNIQHFPSDTTRLYIHNNVITGLLVSVSQNHLSGPAVLRTLLVYSCYKLQLLSKYMCIYSWCFHACMGSKFVLIQVDVPRLTCKYKFDRGHPVVLILTNNIQYFPSHTTRLYIHKNVITGLLVSVSQGWVTEEKLGRDKKQSLARFIVRLCYYIPEVCQ